MNNTTYIENVNDEIDLYKLLKTIIKYRIIIAVAILISLLSATVYLWSSKKIYNGKVLLEIGFYLLNDTTSNDKPTVIQTIDNIGDLKEIIIKTTPLDQSIQEKLIINVPNGSSTLLEIEVQSTNPKKISDKLEKITNYILKRHIEKADFFEKSASKVKMTQIIGQFEINSNPIQPRKLLIIVSALIVGLFGGTILAFALEFFQRNRKPRD